MHSRFWLASQVSHTREIEDARRVLHEAKKIAKTDIGENVNKPLKIVSDGLQSYPEAIRKEFYTMRGPRMEHLRSPGITSARQNNNIAERLNGTKRERMKIMRGYDSMETGQKTTDGERIYYNYIKEHSAIGMTPAQKAGLELGLGQNKWMDLIRQSVNPSPKTALGERASLVEISETPDSETVKPKKWLDREMWKEINSILRTFGYAWISSGKDSQWLKPLGMSRQSTPDSQQEENP